MAAWARLGLIAAIVATAGALTAPPSSARTAPRSAPEPDHRPGFGAQPLAMPESGTHRKVGLGKVLNSADGGQIYGWDINSHGSDGVLTTAKDTQQGYQVSVETFDQNTGKITKSFAVENGPRDSYLADGIFANDVALITHYVEPKGSIFAKRRYDVMNPVTAQGFTGSWQPPLKDFDVKENAENQSTTTSVVYGIELKNDDVPDLVVSNVAADTSTVFHLSPAVYGLDDDPQLAQDTGLNRAVIAYSPDAGAAGGVPPENALVNLTNGHIESFPGYNGGPYGAGSVDGAAVDPTTHVECTTTELNAQVEFYNVQKKADLTAVQLPGTQAGDEFNSGAAVTNDPVNHLFLVADPNYAPTGGSAIVVYDESGKVVESITGFSFSNEYRVVPIRIAVNPSTRTGWVEGVGVDQLQQFFY
jgi:hypothetical protein